jgi:VanZ family protein
VRRVLRHPLTWFAAFAVWFGTLWWLSSKVQHFPPGLDFEFSDKVIHFGYFFGGGIFAAGFFLCQSWPRSARKSVLLAIAAAGLTGALDEYHQSFVPGRSGNDPADLTADLLGAGAGALAMSAARRRWLAPKFTKLS